MEDLRHIEASLSALRGEVSEHVRTMSKRSLISEPDPAKRGIEPRLQVSESIGLSDRRLELAAKIFERARKEGDTSSIDAETLALYGSEASLNEILEQKDPISDLDALVRSIGIDLSRPTM